MTKTEDSSIRPWKDPCLPEFHQGQFLARDGDISQALKHFETALHISKTQAESLDEIYQDWVLYVEATIAYIRNDLITFRTKGKLVQMNEHIIRRLEDGLVKFGKPDYARDYFDCDNN